MKMRQSETMGVGQDGGLLKKEKLDFRPDRGVYPATLHTALDCGLGNRLLSSHVTAAWDPGETTSSVGWLLEHTDRVAFCTPASNGQWCIMSWYL